MVWWIPILLICISTVVMWHRQFESWKCRTASARFYFISNKCYWRKNYVNTSTKHSSSRKHVRKFSDVHFQIRWNWHALSLLLNYIQRSTLSNCLTDTRMKLFLKQLVLQYRDESLSPKTAVNSELVFRWDFIVFVMLGTMQKNTGLCFWLTLTTC